MKSCEKYKNRRGKETEKEISKLFVPIPDWEEKSKPDFFLQNRNMVFRAAGGSWDGHPGPRWYFTETQNHRIVGVGRDLCGSSSPTLLPKQGHLQQAA